MIAILTLTTAPTTIPNASAAQIQPVTTIATHTTIPNTIPIPIANAIPPTTTALIGIAR